MPTLFDVRTDPRRVADLCGVTADKVGDAAEYPAPRARVASVRENLSLSPSSAMPAIGRRETPNWVRVTLAHSRPSRRGRVGRQEPEERLARSGVWRLVFGLGLVGLLHRRLGFLGR
jgi:hypothetical protein